MPLIVYVPWLAASHGQSTSALVEIVDLFPTTLDLFNITARVPDAAQLEGFSFLPLLEQPATAASSFPSTSLSTSTPTFIRNWTSKPWTSNRTTRSIP
mgnify:CR=1 FL=1